MTDENTENLYNLNENFPEDLSEENSHETYKYRQNIEKEIEIPELL